MKAEEYTNTRFTMPPPFWPSGMLLEPGFAAWRGALGAWGLSPPEVAGGVRRPHPRPSIS